MKIGALHWKDGQLKLHVSGAQGVDWFCLRFLSGEASHAIYPDKVEGPDAAGRATAFFPGGWVFDGLRRDRIVLEGLAGERVDATCPLFENADFALYITDDDDYTGRFMLRDPKFRGRISRTGSALGDFLVAARVQSNPAICRAYKSGAAVVMAYKAVELREAAFRQAARAAILDNLAHNDECASDWHPRRDREHLRGSLACAQWHLELMEPDVTRESLFLLLEEEARKAPLLRRTFTPAYPLSMSLLLYVYLLQVSGRQDRAKEVLIVMFELFKRCVADSKIEQTTLFHEIAKVHDCLSLAGQFVRNFEKYETGKLEQLVIAKVFRCPTEAESATKVLLRLRVQEAAG